MPKRDASKWTKMSCYRLGKECTDTLQRLADHHATSQTDVIRDLVRRAGKKLPEISSETPNAS